MWKVHVVHTFDKVLSDEKWKALSCAPCPSGGGRGEEEEHPLSHKYYKINLEEP
jgi:hypothetical protein